MHAAAQATIESGTGSALRLRDHVAVVGGGASGLLTAFQLLAGSVDTDLA